MSRSRDLEGDLLQWAQSKGVSKDLPIRPAFCEDTACRGLIATRAIQQDEIVISIPRPLLMTLDTAFACPVVESTWEFAQREGRALTERQVLAFHLILEQRKGMDSFWHPFISSMPADYDTLENWEDDTIAQLQIPSLIRMAVLRRDEIRDECAHLRQVLMDMAANGPSPPSPHSTQGY